MEHLERNEINVLCYQVRLQIGIGLYNRVSNGTYAVGEIYSL